MSCYTIFGAGGHIGHVTHIHRTNVCHLYPWKLNMLFGFNSSKGFLEEHVYSPGAGADNPPPGVRIFIQI